MGDDGALRGRMATAVTEVHRLLAEADRLAEKARRLDNRSLATRRQALRAVPPGTTLAYRYEAPGQQPYEVTRQDGGWWMDGEGRRVDPRWVRDYWDRGSLRIKEGQP